MIWCNFTYGFPGFTFRRAAALAGGVDERFKIAADYDLLCRLASRDGFGYLPEPGYRRREHDGNATANQLRTNLECASVRERYLRRDAGLRSDPEIRSMLREWYLTLAYWVREAGHARAAAGLYRSVLRIWGWDNSVALAMMKVWPVWGLQRVVGRTPKRIAQTTERRIN
jgi:hypothetical protein